MPRSCLQPRCCVLRRRHGPLHSPTARLHWGRMPLHVASAAATPGVVSLLRAAGADANQADTTGATPLHWAARCNLACVMELLGRHRIV